MKRRIVSVWLPRLATDRLCRKAPAGWRESPLVIAATAGSARLVTALNRAAGEAGLRPGMALASALALVPDLRVIAADPDGDARLLSHLAERCTLFTPWASVASPDGLWLDVSGCGHLFGGEAGLLDALLARLGAIGLEARAALAPTPGAAWAWARFGDAGRPILNNTADLAPLPVAGLRLPPACVEALDGLGLRQIGDLMPLPRAQLSLRFGREVAWRLDQARGVEAEPITPVRPVAPYRVHTAFAEPIARAEDIAATLRHLLAGLCRRLADDGLGARHLDLTLFRIDGGLARAEIGTGAPSHDPRHLFGLFRERLAAIRPGFGIEAARLDAVLTQAQDPVQTDMGTPAGGDALPRLLDSLANRLGPRRLMRLAPHASHLPERAVRRRDPALAPPAEGWPGRRYPIRLLDHPEPIEATAPIPDAPPLHFRWQGRLHRVVRADGPERIASEWWRDDCEDGGQERDYYRVEDERGLRLWLYRLGRYGDSRPPRWYLHGVFP